MSGTRTRCLLFAPPGSRPAAASPWANTVFGLEPVERTALAFQRAGVREFVVAGDSEVAAGVAGLLARGRCAGLRVRAASEAESLLALLGDGGTWYVARSDTLYDRRLVARFVEQTRGAETSVVAVDFRREALSAQEGAPRTASLRIGPGSSPAEVLHAAGHGLMAPDGVFSGLARVHASFGRTLEDAPPAFRSVENALSLLARREPVATWPVLELWQAVRSEPGAREADLALARRKLLAGAVGVADGLVARYVNRPLSQRITLRLLGWNVARWQVSIASFFATLAAGASFAMGHATTGGLMAQFASVLDGVDGEVASIRYQDSPFGGVYEALLDRVGDAAVIGGMTLYAWLAGAGNSAVALGFAAVAGSSLSMLVREKYGTQFLRSYATEREGRWRWLLLGRDGRLFLALVAGVTGYVEAVLAYLAVGTHLHAGVRLYRIRSEA